MNTTKAAFVRAANEHGILHVRVRAKHTDMTGWGALEFTLNNGLVFVVSGQQFGQGEGQDGLWVDFNQLQDKYLRELKRRVLIKKIQADTRIVDHSEEVLNVVLARGSVRMRRGR